MTEGSELTLPALRVTIARSFPECRNGRFSLLTTGWDCVAVDVDDRLIFKFPRHPKAVRALAVEAAVLDAVRPQVAMPLPQLALHEGPPLFSHHPKLPGDHLTSAGYASLADTQRQRLAEMMGQFYAQLHALPAAALQATGAGAVEAWLPPDEILRRVWPVLSEALRPYAEGRIAAWQALPPDPLGTVFGYFDGHGWNMAFDHEKGRLNGLYDFGDSGFGPLHREFIYSNWIARDLTRRIVGAYERTAGTHLDRDRIELLSAVQRLWELAAYADDPRQAAAMVQTVADWAAG